MNNEPLEFGAFLVFVLTFVTSREIAALVGPYAAIFIASCAGAAFSLSLTSKKLAQWWEPVVYIAIRVGVAMVLTVSAALFLKRTAGLDTSVTFIPIAFLIGLDPRWIIDKIKARGDRQKDDRGS